jgi:hypothetical protein
MLTGWGWDTDAALSAQVKQGKSTRQAGNTNILNIYKKSNAKREGASDWVRVP